MARLGELLVATGELTAAEIEQALRAQVMWGGRLGTNLVELGYIDLDKLAIALGRQHRMPPALARHFERIDPAVQGRLSPDVAERYSCVPLLFGGADRASLIVASIAPLEKKALSIIAEEMAIEPTQIIQSIAGELRIRYHLERAYKIPRSTRFLRARGKTIPPFPQFDIDPLAFDEATSDVTKPPPFGKPIEEQAADDSAATDLAIEEARGELRARLENKAAEKERAKTAEPMDTIQTPALTEEDFQELAALSILDDDTIAVPEHVEPDESTGRERRRYLRTIDAPPSHDTQQSLGRISIKRMQIAATVAEEEPAVGLTIGEATRAIRRARDRERVAELVNETLFRFMLSCEAAQMLVIRGETAIGWKGFARSGATLPEIAVPLDQPGLIPRALERCQTCRVPAGDLGPIDQLLLVSLGQKTGDLVVVPVSIASQVMCVIAMATQHDASIATAESVAVAAGAAFARLMRHASR